MPTPAATGDPAMPTTTHTTKGSSESVESRYTEVTQRIADAARKSGRRASDIILCAVTKFADPEQIRTLLHLGHRDFGENRVQVLMQHAAIVEEYLNRQKIVPSGRKVGADDASLFADGKVNLKPAAGLPGGADGVRWHMIGHLQRNKVRKVVEFTRLIHSVDSLRLAEELQVLALKREHPIEVLLQVNCSGESQKFGCPIPAAIPFAEQIGTMINVRLRGIMTMAAEAADPEETRATFRRCRELFEEMSKIGFGENVPFNILSMGMSGDYEVAISEGANIVRVGSAIFGDAKPGVEHAELPAEEGDEPQA